RGGGRGCLERSVKGGGGESDAAGGEHFVGAGTHRCAGPPGCVKVLSREAAVDARTTPTTLTAGDRLARRNALVLAIGQALAGGNNTVLMATGGIVGATIAPDRGFATLPISIYV